MLEVEEYESIGAEVKARKWLGRRVRAGPWSKLDYCYIIGGVGAPRADNAMRALCAGAPKAYYVFVSEDESATCRQ
eukprot:12121759-Heterocapsa_arctica.AAC.1